MPRACPVELHDSCYTESKTNISDATGLSRGDMYDECQVASKLAGRRENDYDSSSLSHFRTARL
jgi:hypothetical protein